MSLLSSTDPSDLANAARCFASCIPPGEQIIVRTHLINNVTIRAQPPCSTPTAPTIRRTQTINDTIIQVLWNQTHNSGTIITGYIVSYGTIPGGPYPLSSGVLPAFPRSYNATGLTPGTTYYFVVQAVTEISGCVSANSNEGSATTTGTPPNTLLTNLVHYYQLQENGAPFVDVGSNPVNLSYTNAGQDYSRVAGHTGANFAAHYSGVNANNSISTVINAGFDFTGDSTGNTSMSYCCWFNWSAAQTNGPPQPMFSMIGAAVNVQAFVLRRTAANTLQWTCIGFNGVGAASVTNAAVADGSWHLAVCGFDFGLGVIWLSVDGGAKQTAALATFNSFNSQPFQCFNWNAGTNVESVGSLSDVGIWNNRVLSAADIAFLWNGGAGLPFSQFH